MLAPQKMKTACLALLTEQTLICTEETERKIGREREREVKIDKNGSIYTNSNKNTHTHTHTHNFGWRYWWDGKFVCDRKGGVSPSPSFYLSLSLYMQYNAVALLGNIL